MGDYRDLVSRNWGRVRESIGEACRRAGRSLDDVRVVAVAKGFPVEAVEAARAVGLTDIGENRVAEALGKAPAAGAGIIWHLVGHLQTNKVRKALTLFDAVYSLDRLSLAEELQKEAERANRRVRCFVEVNASGEAAKGGARPEEVGDLVRQALGLDRLELVGLMTMAPIVDDPEQARPVFRALRELRDELRVQIPAAAGLAGLSMGMSQDYAVAVEEGATHLRLGTCLFGGRTQDKSKIPTPKSQ